MELRRHIEILLLSNDCVIVPNLGGFMAHHVVARYDQHDGMFIPPLRTLGFNPQLNMSDSLLAQSYVDTYDISYPEAVSRVEHEVKLLKQRIEADGKLELPDLGTIYLNDRGRYEFEPCLSGILTPGLYGFGALEIPMLQQKASENPEMGTIRLATRPMGPMEPVQTNKTSKLATIMSQANYQDTPQEEKTISIKVSVLRNLAVTAVAAVALLLFARPVAPGENESASQSEEASVVSITTSSPEESATAEPTVDLFSSLEKVSQKIQISKEVGEVPSPGTYTIVLAYSLPLENAQTFLADIKSKGARKAVLFTYNSENVIAYGSYATQSEAYSQLKTMMDDGSVASGWIMQVK